MNRALKFFRLPLADQGLLLKSAILLVFITLGLRILPFLVLQRLLGRAGQTSTPLSQKVQPTAERLAWAVRVASRYIPAAVCLPQALTVQLLCQQAGYSTHLQIGVLKNQSGQLEAHAWVENQGQVVIGGLQNLPQFSILGSALKQSEPKN